MNALVSLLHGAYGRHRQAFHLALVVLCGFAAYANTFEVPFYYDDFGCVINPAVEDLSTLFDLDNYRHYGFDEDLRNNLVTRPVVYLSFALNHAIHQYRLPGFHLVNLIIHLINAAQVYFLVRLTARLLTSHRPAAGAGRESRCSSGAIALLAALLFVAHPVQTSAVTYLTQRFTALCTLFYLLALLAHAGSVLTPARGRRRLLRIVALLSAVLAMYSKEIAFTLPVMIAIYDFAFLPGPGRARWRRLGPLLLTLLLLPATVLWLASLSEITGNQAANALDLVNFNDTSRWHYLLTQGRVLVTYLRLLLWPAGLNFDYDYPLYTSPADPAVFFSFGLHLLLFCAGVRWLCRAHRAAPQWRLLGFGIVWFYVTISVSSSIVPLADLILEYRLYLPSVGLVAAAAAGGDLLLRRMLAGSPASRTAGVSLVLAVVVALTAATALRNRTWQDKRVFWEDVVAKSPGKKRPHFSLAEAYRKRGRIDDAVWQLEIIEEIGGLSGTGYYHLATIYTLLGRYYEGGIALMEALRLAPDEPDVHAALGYQWLRRGDLRKAINAFRRAQSLDPEDPYLLEILENLEDMRTTGPRLQATPAVRGPSTGADDHPAPAAAPERR